MQVSKPQLVHHIAELIQQKLKVITDDIQSLQADKSDNTKSTAGDKHETSREMAQQEFEKLLTQQAQQRTMLELLHKIDTNQKHASVALGSLVQTTSGVFFLSIPLGKIFVDKQEIFCLSLASPLGKLLLGKGVGETVVFNGKELNLSAVQ